jgi:hypothetical protein
MTDDAPQKSISEVVRNAALETLKASAPGISETMRTAIANSIAMKVRKTFG